MPELELDAESFVQAIEEAVYRGMKRVFDERQAAEDLDEGLWKLTAAIAIDLIAACVDTEKLYAWMKAEEHRPGGKREGVIDAIEYRLSELTEG